MATEHRQPVLSSYLAGRQPTSVRLGQMKFLERENKPELVNGSIGNVMMPMYPALQQRMFNLGASDSPFVNGVVPYTATVGLPETQEAFRQILRSQGYAPDDLFVLVTDGASVAMEIVMLSVSDHISEGGRPILMLDPTYANYGAVSKRTGRKMLTVPRRLDDDGEYKFPDIETVEAAIKESNPSALIVVPYDNPTGQIFGLEMMEKLAALCVKYNMWFISDEAYRELHYAPDQETVSIWGISEERVPGITGRRVSLETASKVWNACGLRIGAVVTDNKEYFTKSTAEYTSNLCANIIGQYIFGAIAQEPVENLQAWYKHQQDYYREQIFSLYEEFKKIEPDFIISRPQASIYFVIDVRKAAKPGFDAKEFVLFCAERGLVDIDGTEYTLLMAPMGGFYDKNSYADNPGDTQMRISFCENPEKLKFAPRLLSALFREFEAQR